jgi:hypothetical protein
LASVVADDGTEHPSVGSRAADDQQLIPGCSSPSIRMPLTASGSVKYNSTPMNIDVRQAIALHRPSNISSCLQSTDTSSAVTSNDR